MSYMFGTLWRHASKMAFVASYLESCSSQCALELLAGSHRTKFSGSAGRSCMLLPNDKAPASSCEGKTRSFPTRNHSFTPLKLGPSSTCNARMVLGPAPRPLSSSTPTQHPQRVWPATWQRFGKHPALFLAVAAPAPQARLRTHSPCLAASQRTHDATQNYLYA